MHVIQSVPGTVQSFPEALPQAPLVPPNAVVATIPSSDIPPEVLSMPPVQATQADPASATVAGDFADKAATETDASAPAVTAPEMLSVPPLQADASSAPITALFAARAATEADLSAPAVAADASIAPIATEFAATAATGADLPAAAVAAYVSSAPIASDFAAEAAKGAQLSTPAVAAAGEAGASGAARITADLPAKAASAPEQQAAPAVADAVSFIQGDSVKVAKKRESARAQEKRHKERHDYIINVLKILLALVIVPTIVAGSLAMLVRESMEREKDRTELLTNKTVYEKLHLQPQAISDSALCSGI